LGNVVSKEGIPMDLEKIRSIMELVAPRNVDEVILHGVGKLLPKVHQELLKYFLSYYIIAEER